MAAWLSDTWWLSETAGWLVLGPGINGERTCPQGGRLPTFRRHGARGSTLRGQRRPVTPTPLTPGSLSVTGSGSTTQGGDFSGGTIQNTTGFGISLTNTTGPSFRNMRLLNTGNSGVNGTQVNGFSFTDGTITGAGDASDENSITFDDSLTSTPNLTGVVTITNNVISLTEAEGIDIENWAGTISNANISNNALSDTGDVATPGSAITLIGTGLATRQPTSPGRRSPTTRSSTSGRGSGSRSGPATRTPGVRPAARAPPATRPT